jgi:carbon-monoxide dehydrogenase medium subunit
MTRAERYLEGRAVTLAEAEATAGLVADDLAPLADGRGGADLRRRAVRAATRRLVAEAAGLDWREKAA